MPDMTKVIIYKQANGELIVVKPAPECNLTIEQIAMKDVPAGVPYLILDNADLPTDYTFQMAWEADFSQPHGSGADYGVGSFNEVIGYDEDNNPIINRVDKLQ